MTKEMTFLKENGKKIQGQMYMPQKADKKMPIVIFCHGLGGNFRELAHYGDRFAKAGICCLYFDFCGGGVESLSDGNTEDMTIFSECRDLETVLACVKELDYIDSSRIFLMGESMGGLVSALVAARHPEDVRAMVLWYPAFVIPDGAKERHEKGERVFCDFLLGRDFDREAKEIDVYGTISGYDGRVLLIHGEEDDIVPLSYSRRAEEIYQDARLIVIPGAGHGFDGADSDFAGEQSISFLKKLIPSGKENV